MASSGLSITPIGTCRLKTPLQRGEARYPIRLDLQRIYGFTHTSEEALQQLRYRRGEQTFPSDVATLLFRPGDTCRDEPAQLRPADLTIVEISSAKLYRVGDTPVQSNYLTRHFADFFASPARARAFWSLASGASGDARRDFLEHESAARMYGEGDRDLLARLTVRHQTYDELLADMATLVDIIGNDRLLFVTHVNGATPDGNLVASRDKLIRWVTKASQHLGTPLFDPTNLMRELGQDRAMERGGLDLTHFTGPFSDRWYAWVQRHHVLPRIVDGDGDAGDAGASDVGLLTESIAAAFEYEDFFIASRQLFEALDTHRGNVPLQLMHGALLSRIGDYEGAARVLSRHVDSSEMTPEARQALMRALLKSGDPKGALSVACQLLTDEYEDGEVYQIAGLAAERLGQVEDAWRYRKLSFRLDPANYATALWVLDQYTAVGKSDLLEGWLSEVLEIMGSHGDPSLARAVAEWAVANRNDAAFSCAFAVLVRIDISSVPVLIDEAARVGMEATLAKVAPEIMALPDVTEKTKRALRQLAGDWSERSEKLSQQGRLGDAFALARAALAVAPNTTKARRVQLSITRCLREQVRSTQNDAEAVSVYSQAGEAIFDNRQTVLLYARSLVAVCRAGDALAVLKRAIALHPHYTDVRAALAHLANTEGDFALALETYGVLSEEPEADIARHKIRIERFLDRAAVLGIHHMRDLLASANYADAAAVWHLLKRYSNRPKKIDDEEPRVVRRLRISLRQLDTDGSDTESIQELVGLMLALQPYEPSVLRRAALEAMRREEFSRAIELWHRFELVSPKIPSTANNIQRCEILSRRHARHLAVRQTA
jgi:tetratricopeptide (TPR) repeat protein